MRLQHTRVNPGVEPTRPAAASVDETLHREPTFLESLALNPHAAHIPHALVTSDEMVRIALALGNPDFLRHHREHRNHLTMQCQLCLEVYPYAEDMYEHLQDTHQAEYDAGQPILNMLYWAVFKHQGCCCNPGPSWHSGPHVCIPLLQAAMLLGKQANQLVIPWQFKGGELLRVLDGILLPDDMYDLAFAMLIRRFDYLDDARLKRALQDRCLLCRALIEHDTIEAHLQQVHPDLGLGPTLIFDQLGFTDWPLVQDLGFRRQLSILLAFPKWHSLISNDDSWPSTDQVLQHLQLRQLIMSQNTAPISALQDPQLTITEAFLLLDDPWMTDVLKYRCTICHAMIFQPSLMLKHLQAHNMYQYDTHCNLQFLMDCAGDPCYFCHLAHPAACRDLCVPALNVALHISYVSRRRDELYLVQPFDTGSIGNIGQSGQGNESSIHAAQQKTAACSHSSGDQDTGPAHEESHHLGPASRGHTECHDVRAPTGVRVKAALCRWCWRPVRNGIKRAQKKCLWDTVWHAPWWRSYKIALWSWARPNPRQTCTRTASSTTWWIPMAWCPTYVGIRRPRSFNPQKAKAFMWRKLWRTWTTSFAYFKSRRPRCDFMLWKSSTRSRSRTSPFHGCGRWVCSTIQRSGQNSGACAFMPLGNSFRHKFAHNLKPDHLWPRHWGRTWRDEGAVPRQDHQDSCQHNGSHVLCQLLHAGPCLANVAIHIFERRLMGDIVWLFAHYGFDALHPWAFES